MEMKKQETEKSGGVLRKMLVRKRTVGLVTLADASKLTNRRGKLMGEIMEISSILGQRAGFSISDEDGTNYEVSGSNEYVLLAAQIQNSERTKLFFRIKEGKGEFDVEEIKQKMRNDPDSVEGVKSFFPQFFRNSLKCLHDRFGYFEETTSNRKMNVVSIAMGLVCEQLLEYYQRNFEIGAFVRRCLEDPELWEILWEIKYTVPEVKADYPVREDGQAQRFKGKKMWRRGRQNWWTNQNIMGKDGRQGERSRKNGLFTTANRSKSSSQPVMAEKNTSLQAVRVNGNQQKTSTWEVKVSEMLITIRAYLIVLAEIATNHGLLKWHVDLRIENDLRVHSGSS
jgi:hypothetical protein